MKRRAANPASDDAAGASHRDQGDARKMLLHAASL